ncbi:cadherin EGF LAG seven-pass G-type receptor, putative [Actinidia rufa]|uniref:Cadherin EGF LAG seven-pass G-type receptor, putative n=1 Tax=Actinidia rufa TaxID=165716 RepID=A0A7J0F337_9ERIC|nr:cadherin EGF LAG seven-pass G-type receptor, putative [Actinidia rufa]
MELTPVKAEKDDKKEEDSVLIMNKDKELADDNSVPKRMVKKLNSRDLLALNVKQMRRGEICIQESFIRHIQGLGSRVPKHIISLDEKYLRRCLELIHMSASKGVSCNTPRNLGSSDMGTLSDSLSSLKIGTTYACDLAQFVTECPLGAGAGNLVINPAEEWIVGSISGGKSILNILKSPLLRQFGVMESEINFARTNLMDTTKSVGSDFMSSPGWFSIGSSHNLEKKTVVIENDSYSEQVHKRLGSVSSTNSTFSDHSSSAVSTRVTQGMLQCTWKAGFPHYVFSVYEQTEVYEANLFKNESPEDKVLDYMYVFHSRAGGKKEHGVRVNELGLVGKMRVSTTFSLCPNNSQTLETEFVLFGSDESSLGEIQTSTHNPNKNKRLSKKTVKVFKTGQSLRERTSSKYVGTSVILENSSWNPCYNKHTNPNLFDASNLSDNIPPPNLELAAIVVKDHIRGSHQAAETGGWGLKFLKKIETTQPVASMETSPSGCCLRNVGDCSTSMNILVPAGFHGGPRNRNGGPSSLIERWSSGGGCDCGGWDIGCPITVLNTSPTTKEVSSRADMQGDKSFELFIQGSKRGSPIMKMEDIHDGLYLIHFKSTLSALQSFSIAVAIIHTRMPALQPSPTQSVQEVK